ncbi:MAG TPA: hypothetical protein PKD18_14585, partial [Saprospiraceae bacterium]|nr:hypothetical protein [Saprospiraceae bacterium]
DACGNYSTASQIIEVDDQIAPEITSIPENETVDCKDLVRGAEPSQVIATDNCDVPTISVESDVISNLVCVNQYTITRTYVATDACGNYSTASQIIEVDDQISPQITQIPNDETVSCGELVADADPDLILATDNCDVPTISVETDIISNYVCPNQYTITRTYVATDACGNTSSSSQIIQVDDQISPTIISIPLDELVSCELNVSDPNTSEVISNDNCESSPTISVLPDVIQNQICDNRYTIVRTYIATDACGNTTSSTQTITVYDETGPRINSIPEDLIVSCESDIPETSVGLVQSEDECGGQPEISVEPDIITNSICASQFTVLRTYVAKDGCGNTSSSTQTIEVKDETSPTITSIPSNETISCEDLVPNTQESEVIATDNCGGNVTISVEADVISNYICINQYRITRTYVARDACGNYSTASQIIEVDDQTSPEITSIPENETVDCEDLVRGAEPSQVIATDNCDVPTISVETDVISNYICVNQYTITRTYVATDACGNYSTASQIIEVDDQISPQITQIPNDETVSCGELVADADPDLILATDNCDVPTISVETDIISNYVCPNQYTITRTYVATDACGNTSSSSQIIQVDDQISPTIISIPLDELVSCELNVSDPNTSEVISNDNCESSPTISVLPDVIQNQICDNRYTIVRTYIATDACGNTTSSTQTITVYDETGPRINSIPEDLIVSCESDIPETSVGLVQSEDECGGQPEISVEPDIITNSICASQFTVLRTYVAKDGCGNTSSSTQTIEVKDETSPTITSIPSNETISCEDLVPNTQESEVIATDNCGGNVTISVEADVISNYICINQYRITRTYVARDACGNYSTASQIIEVDDQIAPEITSIPENETVDCKDLVRGAEPSQVIATDNCDVPTISVESDVISNLVCVNQYTITRTYVATDACGNSSTASQIIEVDDRISPQITQIPNDETVSCSELVAHADLGLVLATDNCDIPTISVKTDIISNYVCPNQYTITRTYVATDACENTSSSSQIIQVDDQISPTINYLPENLTLSCAGDVPEPNIGLVSASDNCGATIISVNEDVISNQICANQYTITRTYVATDACGNTTTSSQQIDV